MWVKRGSVDRDNFSRSKVPKFKNKDEK